MPERVKIAVIGEAKVGKTSFIRRFKTGQFFQKNISQINSLHSSKELQINQIYPRSGNQLSVRCKSSTKSQWLHSAKPPPGSMKSFEPSPITPLIKKKNRCPCCHCSVIFTSTTSQKQSEQLVDITFFDVPRIEKFPLDSLEEWDLDQALGVRSANAYILLYDVTNKQSFDYVKNIRKEILWSFYLLHNGVSPIYSHCLSQWEQRPKLRRKVTDDKIKPNESRNDQSQLTPPIRARQKQEKKRNTKLIQHMGLTGLYSASLAHPSIQLDRLSSVFKPPPIFVVGNKEDLCHVFRVEKSFLDKTSKPFEPLQFERQVLSPRAFQLNKLWKTRHFECSVKQDWNVKAVVREILGELLKSETRKSTRFKKSFDNFKKSVSCTKQ